ncbi:restriction endonuclease subunit S [Cetobacterium sp.]|uniref:restriction endonuclease subunit S n=1 Tax=Cetobacterium sp. TaxID=2071632 RepID=UPI003F3580E7
MSKLEQLINELCPDGVEYKLLKDISIMKRGVSITKKDLTEGDIPVISGGKEPAYYCDKYNREDETITVAGSGAGAGYVQYWNKPIFVCDAFSIKAIETNSTKYLFYFLQNIQKYIYSTKQGSGIPHVYISSIEKVSIPLPPLPVQEEIVRILDTFTELTAELTAELTMRKQQYEYYRDSLLINNKFSERVLLKSVVKKGCSGGTPKKGEEKFYLNGTVPWLRTQDVKFNEIFEINSFITEEAVKKTSAKWIPANCVIVAISGATAGRCAINKVPTTTNQHCYNMEIDETKALYKYIYYCVYSQYEELLSRKQGARGDLNSSLILGITIPLPPLEEQQRIVDILDRFDTLVNDIKDGLPAEIEARKQQYEYYRDKLLTFKKLI